MVLNRRQNLGSVVSIILLIGFQGSWIVAAAAADQKAVPATAMPKKKQSLKDLSWLVGQWQSKDGDTLFEEHWMSPAGGMMIGMGREVKKDKLSFHEYLRLEERADGIYYVAQPFGKSSTDFRLTKNDDSILVFENPQHDFPNCIKYKKQKDGSIQVLGSGQEDKKAKSFEYVLRKKSPRD